MAKIGGLSLLERAISGSLECKLIERTIVTSDSEKILRLAARLGAETHKRQMKASTDTARAADVVFDLLESHFGKGLPSSTVFVYLQPTSPFRKAAHIGEALSLNFSSKKPCVSVKKSSEPPSKAVRLENGLICPYVAENSDLTGNRQSNETYHPNGAIYVFSKRDFLNLGDIPVAGAVPFLMSRLSSIDIDEQADLEIAEGVAGLGHI